MNKKSQYTAFEWQIIAGSVMIVLVALLFIADSGITGFATKTQPTEITLIEQNTTPILIEKPILEKPAEVEGTVQEPPKIETQAGCVVPTDGLHISSNTILCSGEYYLSTGIYIDGSNIVLEGNGTTLNANDYSDINKNGIYFSKGSNITVKNMNIVGFGSACIFAANYNIPSNGLAYDINIINNNLSNCGGIAGIYTSGLSRFNISGNRIYDSGDNGQGSLGSHAIYISGDTGEYALAGVISNNIIYNVSASGIKFNSVETTSNIKIFNNNITDLRTTRGDDIGIHLTDTSNISIYNNYFEGGYARGVLLNIGGHNISHFAHGSRIYNNTFNNLGIAIEIRSGTYDNYIYNNVYISNEEDFRIQSLANFSAFEQDKIRIGQTAYTIFSILNFSGPKNFTINSYNFTIYNGNNQWKPYNDVKNRSNDAILASNVDTFSIMLAPGQQIEVGDFVADPVPSNTAPVMDSVILSDNLTCITVASDADDDSLTTTIEWYYNSTLNKTVIASSDTQSNMTGTHYCRARAYDGTEYSDWMTSNTVIINATVNVTVNQTNDTYIDLSSITLSNDLNCSGTINKLSNITIDYYLDGSLNTTIELETSGAFIGYAEIYNGSWYCNVTASDGINTTSRISNTVIINGSMSNVSINTQPVITVGLSNGLVCSGTVNELVNMTILFFKDSAVEKNIVLQDINGSFSASADESPGTWYCQVSATDGLNTTIVQSNTVTINDPKSPSRGGGGGGSGGGSSISSPIKIKEKPKEEPTIIQENTTQETPQKVVEETEQEDITPIIEETAPVVIEHPRKLSIWEKYWKIYLVATIIFFIATIIIKTGNKTNEDEQLTQYIIKSLHSGYSYSAIRKALKKYYKQPVIDHHFYLLRKFNLKPLKTKKIEKFVSKEREKEALMSITTYIKQQKSMNYAVRDIKKVLIQNGYPKKLVEEAIENA